MPDSPLFPLGAGLRLLDLETNPHSLLHRLRASEPVSWVPAMSGWLVTRHDLACKVMRDARAFTVDHPGFSTAKVVGPSMLSLDGRAHSRHRRPFERPFRQKEIRERFHAAIVGQANSLLDGLVSRGEAELRREYAGPIAVQTMIAALGLGDLPIASLLAWYDVMVDAVTGVTAGEPVSPEGRRAFAALSSHLRPVLRRDPASSLLAAAGGLAGELTEPEIISNAAVLLFGGIETTEGMIANAFFHLLTNRNVLAQVHQRPGLLPAAIEESLRLEPAAAVVDRYAVRDVTLARAEIRAGDLVRVSLSAANRDPAVFEQPDDFRPWRPGLKEQVAFAQGPHVCLGLHLARLEADQALKIALERLPDLRLAASPAAAAEARPRGLLFRKPAALNVTWNATKISYSK